MNTKHTPGPWKLGRNPHNIIASINGADEIVAQICDMPCIGGFDDIAAERGSEMEKANARLISAAPELLETCKLLSTDDLSAGQLAQRIAYARAVIAKATGSAA